MTYFVTVYKQNTQNLLYIIHFFIATVEVMDQKAAATAKSVILHRGKTNTTFSLQRKEQ